VVFGGVHPDKCNVHTYSRNKTPVRFNYYLHGHVLQEVDKAKYLGVTISEDLKWESHINISASIIKAVPFNML
jgi:hypothetical protein